MNDKESRVVVANIIDIVTAEIKVALAAERAK